MDRVAGLGIKGQKRSTEAVTRPHPPSRIAAAHPNFAVRTIPSAFIPTSQFARSLRRSVPAAFTTSLLAVLRFHLATSGGSSFSSRNFRQRSDRNFNFFSSPAFRSTSLQGFFILSKVCSLF
uniref:Uncharacterized protein n=2 Tax=Cucumis melo TaxID=3656 RepID=A0A9I9EKE6_CUCME